MNTIRRILLASPLSIAALTVATTAPLGAWAGMTPHTTTSKYSDTKTLTTYRGWEDPAMRDVAASSGRALVARLQAVGAELDLKEVNQARADLVTSSEFADALVRMMPYSVVADDIRNAKNSLVAEDSQEFYEDLLPIYASLNQLEVYAPDTAKNAHKKIKQAENQARHSDKKAASQTLQEVAEDIAATNIYLPVRYVRGQISVAVDALDRSSPNVDAAKTAVNNALDSLTAFRVDTVITPQSNT